MRMLFAASIVAVSVFMLVVASETRTACLAPESGEQKRASLPILSGGKTLHFVENGGRYPAEARFVARSGCLTTWVTDDGFRFSLAAPPPNRPREDRAAQGIIHNVFMTFEGRSSATRIEPGSPTRTRYSEFSGPTAEHWKTDLRSYESLTYHELYRGVDMCLRDAEGRLEYDLVLDPGADVADVIVRIEGADALRLDGDTLVVETPLGDLNQQIPATFVIGESGERAPVAARFRLIGDCCFGFEVPERPEGAGLLIDPTVFLSTFLGGAQGEEGLAVATAPDRAIYVAGEIRAPDYPGYPGLIAAPVPAGYCKSMVTKLDPTGTQMLQVAVVGDPTGVGLSIAHDIEVTVAGEPIVTGITWLGSFVTTPGAYQPTPNGGTEVFLYKLNNAFTALTFSTLLGGSGNDEVSSLCCAANANIILVGKTDSTNFPGAGTPLQAANGGGTDGFVAVLDSTGSNLLSSTYIGGVGEDEVTGCVVDPAGMEFHILATIVGSPMPTTPGAYQATNPGQSSTWMARLNLAGSLLAATYFGGTSNQNSVGIDRYTNGDICLAGETDSTGFPATAGSVFPAGGGGRDAFLARMTASGTTLTWATYLGGTGNEIPWDVSVDTLDHAFIAGQTASLNYPLTPGAFDTTIGTLGKDDGFLTRVTPNGAALDYSTFLGGSDTDVIAGVFSNDSGQVYVTGTTLSPDFPTIPGGPQTVFGGGYSDIFLTALEFCSGIQASVTALGPGCNLNDPVLIATPPIIGGIADLQINSTLPGRPAALFFSFPPVTTVVVPPCNVYVDVLNAANFSILAAGVLPASGSFKVTYPIPGIPALSGFQVIIQAGVLDPAGPLVSSFLSNGLLLTFGCP